LVTAELLDRTVALHVSEELVTILDVGVEQSRSREWLVDQLFVRKTTSGFRRRGESMVVDWNEVTNMSLPVPDQPAEQLLATMDSLRPADVASMLRELTPKRRAEIARELDDERLADVLEEMTDQNRVEILEALEAERAADILEEMDPDDAADLISELAPERAEDLLERMEPDEADDIRRLLSYDDFSAGGMMTSEPIILAPDETVADALAQIRNADLSPALASQVYVCRQPTETPTGKYLGVCHFQRLLREPPSTLVSAILDTSLEPMRPDTPLSVLTRSFAAYNLVALPVVDSTGSLVGAVTVDDLVDHMLPQGWREAPAGWESEDPAVRNG